MKKKLGALFIVLFAVIMLGAAQPTLLYAGGETGGGNLWDPFVNTNPINKPVAVIPGTLTIIYNPLSLLNFFPSACTNGQATMFYSLRLIYGKSQTPYTFEGNTQVCLGDIGTVGSGGQGDVILNFMKYVLLGYFPAQSGLTVNQWNIKSINNPGISGDSLSFVADITVAVR